jgi:tRNA(Ile2) C34 agmatinyltransferase TiaS
MPEPTDNQTRTATRVMDVRSAALLGVTCPGCGGRIEGAPQQFKCGRCGVQSRIVAAQLVVVTMEEDRPLIHLPGGGPH